MKTKTWMVSSYNQDWSWVKRYTTNYHVYEQGSFISNDDRSKNVEHKGTDLHDKFSYIVENYDKLSDVTVFIKANLFKYITPAEFDAVKDNTEFTPLFTKFHKTYLPVCFYDPEDGMYSERNDNWYINQFKSNFQSYHDFSKCLRLPCPQYLKFAPGSNYIVPKENILKRPKYFYEKMIELLAYTSYSAEAQMIERSLFEIWK